ncbi:MAG: HAMP domain-containing histidine kinase [Chloroflexi bacterium]|nr:HAMP domain-containing histidine kinase [Chloroflexota bacterium]
MEPDRQRSRMPDKGDVGNTSGWRWSVRMRLAFVNGIVVTVLLLAVLTAQYVILRHVLINRTAALLRAQAHAVIQRDLGPRPLVELTDPLAKRLTADLATGNTSVVVLNLQAKAVADIEGTPRSSSSVTPPPPRVADVQRALRGGDEITYEDNAAGGHDLVALIPVRVPSLAGAIIGVVQLSTPLADVDATLRNLLIFDAAGAMLGIAVAALSAPAVSQTALAPLQKITLAARAIAAGDLGQRAALRAGSDEIGELGTAFDHMADRVEATIATQRRFVADASHELRTPLAVLASGLEVLQMDPMAGAERRDQLIEQLRREAGRMGKLVQELLDLASFDRGITLERRTADVARILRDVADEARLLSPRHQIIDEAPSRLSAQVDPDRIRQLLLILADNSIHHTEVGGKVHLVAAVRGERLLLQVLDTGSGIPAELLPHVFDRFFRADKARARTEGRVGLGLAIARSIAEAHGGSIEIESTVGVGTRVTVLLPVTVSTVGAKLAH